MSKKQKPAVQIPALQSGLPARPALQQPNGGPRGQQQRQGFQNPNLSRRPPRRPGGR
jgi:hypothetical protein